MPPEELYFVRLDEEFNGDLNGLLQEEVWNFPAVIYLEAENGLPNREAGRIEPGTAWDDLFGAINVVEWRLMFLAGGIITHYNDSPITSLVR